MVISTPEVVQRAADRDLGIDIFWPDSDAKRTAVILLHGGGWSFGHRSEMHRYARLLRDRGFVAIAAEYRLTGEAPWPVQILDVKDVIRWVAGNADWLRIDPAKIALQGFSSGGHLALLAAATAGGVAFGAPAPVAAVVSLFAPPDLTQAVFPVRPPPLISLFGPEGNEDLARAASPLYHIAPGFPPAFLLSGMEDKLLPYQQTLRLFETLAAVGTPVELHLYQGHTHEFAAMPSITEPVQAEIALFLDRTVANPDFYREENLRLNKFAGSGAPPGS